MCRMYTAVWHSMYIWLLFILQQSWSMSSTFSIGIVDYMSEQAGPPSKQVQAAKQIQELIKDGDDAVIVGVFSSEQDAAYDIYIEACK